MWRELLQWAKTVVLLAEELQRNREEIKEVRQELRHLARIVDRLDAELRATEQREATERDNLVLRLENQLLRMEQRLARGLPPPNKDDEGD
jgi:septal ring factor EnvC (AmiA/AmiB activator)